MKKLLRGLVLLGTLAGAAYAARSYLQGEPAGQDAVQLVFDDGSPRSLASNTAEGQEFTDIARKVIEIGV
jgi:hypothetical protein